MRRVHLLILASALQLGTGAAHAQGGPDPDGRRLRLGTDSLAIFLIRGADTTRTGLLRDELTVIREGDRELLRRVYSSVDRVLGSRIDTLVDGLGDVRPVRHRSRSSRAIESLDFAGGRARGWLRLSSGDSVPVNVAADNAFNASSFDLVLRSSSLRTGWDVTVPTLVAQMRAVAPMHARVIGTETIGNVVCWRVQAEFGGTPVTFWIGQATRAIEQQIMQVGPDVQILFRRAAPDKPTPRTS